MNNTPEQTEDNTSDYDENSIPKFDENEMSGEEELQGDLITIARFSYLYEAELLAGKLEAEGIPAFIPDAMTVSVDPFLVNTIGGIRVQIPDTFHEQAKELLAELSNKSKPAESKPKFVMHNGKKMRLNNGVCMECGEAGLYMDVLPLWRSILSSIVAVGADLPMQKQRNCWCSSCNAEWTV